MARRSARLNLCAELVDIASKLGIIKREVGLIPQLLNQPISAAFRLLRVTPLSKVLV